MDLHDRAVGVSLGYVLGPLLDSAAHLLKL